MRETVAFPPVSQGKGARDREERCRLNEDRVAVGAMTVIYSGQHYHLSEDAVTIRVPGEAPRAVDFDALPLPVARALQSWRASGSPSTLS